MQDSDSSGLSRDLSSDADRRKIRSASLGRLRERPKEDVVQDCGQQEPGSFSLPRTKPSDSGRKRTLSESLGSLQDRPKKHMANNPQSYSEKSGPVQIRPEAATLRAPVQLTRELRDISPPRFCGTSDQNFDWIYDLPPAKRSQSGKASDPVVGSVLLNDQLPRSVNEQNLIKPKIHTPGNSGGLCNHKDPFSVITSTTRNDLDIGRSSESTCIGGMESLFSIDSNDQMVTNQIVQPSKVDAQTAKGQHQVANPTKPLGSTQESCSKLSLEDWARRKREIHELSEEAYKLGQKQQECILTSRRLEQRINQGELTYGEMLRKSLELRRALEKRRQHISEDESSLERERMSAKSMEDRIRTILAKIMSISGDGDTGSVKSES